MRKLAIFLGTVLVAAVALAGAVAVAAPQLAAVATAGDGDPKPIDLEALDDYAIRSDVLAADGTLLATLHGVENRQPVPLDQVPEPVVRSILTIEDAEFYLHSGINLRSIGRALVENVSAGDVEQGGSTITQQLVKNTLLNDETTLERKIEEAVLAMRLEEQVSKDEILETYLNTVYFGSGAYGVQAAAETYWGKNVQDLDWAEGAMLAALIANPIAYDPTLYPERANEQRSIAFDRLVSAGVLTRDEANFVALAPIPVARCTGNPFGRPEGCGEVDLPPINSYFVEKVKNDLLDVNQHQYDALGTTYDERVAAVFGGGLQIHTTLDPAAQSAAETAHAEETPENDLGVTSAFAAVEPSSGAVRAVVGGLTFGENKFDIALQGQRQVGSTFKTFVMLEALEQGAVPDDRVSGTITMTDPGTERPYTVTGAGGTLTSVLTASSNGAFVRLNQVVGPDNVVELAGRVGIDVSGFAKIPSLPLGSASITPLQMAAAYSAIPNGGMYNQPYFVERIEDAQGNTIFEHEGAPTRAFSERSACYANQILEANVTGGTGRNAALSGQAAAGKTGTTTGPTDVWFVGYTPYLTTAVWLGNPEDGGVEVDDQNEATERTPLSRMPGREAWGSTYPAAIWQRFNELYHEGRDAVGFIGCPPPDRPGRPLQGENDPFGTLNGGSDPTGQGVLSGPMKGRVPTRQPSRPAPSAPDGGGDGGTTIESPPPTEAPPPTDPPAQGGNGGGFFGGVGGGGGGNQGQGNGAQGDADGG